MASETNAVAIIPARGGSKRIPRKNLADFAGRPALAHVIDTAEQAGVFDQVAVSTDDDEISAVAKACGASVIQRPADIADDHTPVLPVVQHAIRATGESPQTICMMFATSVFIKSAMLRDAWSMLVEDPHLDYVIAVKRFESAPQRGLRMQGNKVAMLHPEHFNTRSQDLDPLFHDAGLFSFGTAHAWMTGLPSFTANTAAIEVGPWDAVDIDEPEDLEMARLIFERQTGR